MRLVCKRLAWFSVALGVLLVLQVVSSVYLVVRFPLPVLVIVCSTSAGTGLAALWSWRISGKIAQWRPPWAAIARVLKSAGKALFSWKRQLVFLICLAVSLPVLFVTTLWIAITFELAQKPVVYGAGLASALLAVAMWLLAGRLLARGPRFSTLELLSAMAVLSLFLAAPGRWFAGVSQQELAVRRLEVAGGQITYVTKRPEENPWLSYDPTISIEKVRVQTAPALDQFLRDAGHFKSVSHLELSGGVAEIRPAHVQRLNSLPHLKALSLNVLAIDGQSLRNLSRWKNGVALNLWNCYELPPHTFHDVAQMRQLRFLTVLDKQGVLSQRQLQAVGKLRQLKYLSLCASQLTDKDIPKLASLSSLENLDLHYTSITPAGIEQLCNALPDCHIQTDAATDGRENVKKIRVQHQRDGVPFGPEVVLERASEVAEVCRIVRAGVFRPGVEGLTKIAPEAVPERGLRVEFLGESRVFYRVVIGIDGFYYNVDQRPWLGDHWWRYPRSTFTGNERDRLVQLIGRPRWRACLASTLAGSGSLARHQQHE